MKRVDEGANKRSPRYEVRRTIKWATNGKRKNKRHELRIKKNELSNKWSENKWTPRKTMPMVTIWDLFGLTKYVSTNAN